MNSKSTIAETLYLIDGYAQIFRAYYAIRGGMRSPVTSEPTHAIFGFTGMLLKLFSQFHPHYVAVAIDAPGKTFRDDLYGQYRQIRQAAALDGGEPLISVPETAERARLIETPVAAPPEARHDQYKGTREATPDDLTSQIPRIFEVIEGFGIPIIGEPGLEADDVIASITQRILDTPDYADVNIRIVSKDKDLEQLLCDRVALFDIHTETMLDVDGLNETRGIAPEQVIDMLALMGDTVDNIPGVEGIGPKTAAQLVQQFGSIDGIFANLDQIKGKRRENLEKARDILPISRSLVTLKRDADFAFTLEQARVRPIELNTLLPLFRQLGFNRYQDEARQLADREKGRRGEGESKQGKREEGRGKSSQAEQSEIENRKSKIPDPRPPTPDPCIYEAILTREQLAGLVETLRAQPIIAVDTETNGLARDAQLCGLSFAWQPGQGVYIPVRSPEPDKHLDEATVLQLLRPVLEDPDLPKCGHNLKFDANVLLRSGVKLQGVVFDSMLASILIDPAQPGHKLDYLALAHFNYQMIPISDLIGSGEGQVTMEQVPLDKVVPYAAEDTDIALRLYHHLLPVVEEMEMAHLLREIEAPLAPILAEMEINGILCDPEELRRQGELLGVRTEELRKQIQQLAGCEFQIESTRQLAEVLFDKLGFQSAKKTKTGRSTDITVLEKLAAQEDLNNPCSSVPRLVIEYRQLTKLISTYLGNLRDAIDPADGRIHTTFHQLVTATGRLASHNPNLQNIPVRSEVGRQIRKAFTAPPGSRLICADYSQIELRLLAHLSRDPALMEAFAQDQDIHTLVAAQVFGVPLEQVTREQRARAKTINFGIIYGITPFGLARRIEGMDVAGATELIAEYNRRFPGILEFLEKCVHEAREQGYVRTITGRRRAIPEIYSPNRSTQNLGERLAINSVVQGSAADLIKAAMVNVQRRIDRDRLPVKMLLQIHDELVLEAPAEAAAEQAQIVCAEMERAMTLSVPLRAEAGAGPDWLSAK